MSSEQRSLSRRWLPILVVLAITGCTGDREAWEEVPVEGTGIEDWVGRWYDGGGSLWMEVRQRPGGAVMRRPAFSEGQELPTLVVVDPEGIVFHHEGEEAERWERRTEGCRALGADACICSARFCVYREPALSWRLVRGGAGVVDEQVGGR